MKARPFIKWAGGKTQLLPQLLPLFPAKIKTYYEPFIGGGAVFWALADERRFERAALNDWNPELVNVYQTVRDDVEGLIANLTARASAYAGDPKTTFEAWRDELPQPGVAQAGRTIALNKTCFNGLYRVNRKGRFNVPFGKYKNPTICDADNLRSCSRELHGRVNFSVGDFAPAVQSAGEGDLVYFDPPYVPASATSNFTTYTSGGFTMDDQRRLADLFRALACRGVRVVLSNSDVEAVHSLYDGFTIHRVAAKRSINSKASNRGPVGEVIVIGG